MNEVLGIAFSARTRQFLGEKKEHAREHHMRPQCLDAPGMRMCQTRDAPECSLLKTLCFILFCEVDRLNWALSNQKAFKSVLKTALSTLLAVNGGGIEARHLQSTFDILEVVSLPSCLSLCHKFTLFAFLQVLGSL